jgi:hypothetical protein
MDSGFHRNDEGGGEAAIFPNEFALPFLGSAKKWNLAVQKSGHAEFKKM